MVFNATFNNISVISWLSVLFLEETGVHVIEEKISTRKYRSMHTNVAGLPIEGIPTLPLSNVNTDIKKQSKPAQIRFHYRKSHTIKGTDDLHF
jgi:hypothetical protein